MVAYRALTTRLSEPQRRLRHLRWLCSTAATQRRHLSASVLSSGVVGFHGHNAAHANKMVLGLIPFRRNVSSTVPMLQLPAEVPSPEEHDGVTKKKSILGLSFLSKLFGRDQVETPAVSETPSSVESIENEAAADASLYSAEQAEESAMQDQEVVFSVGAENVDTLDTVEQFASAPYEEQSTEVSGIVSEPSTEAIGTESVLAESEAIVTENVELRRTEVVEQTEQTDLEAAAPVAPGEPASEISASPVPNIRDFIESLPPLPASEVAAPVTPKPVTSPASEKPAVSTASEKVAISSDSGKPPASVKTAATPEKRAVTPASEKPAVTSASEKPAATPEKPAVTPASEKPASGKPAAKAATKTTKKASPSKPGATAAQSTPIASDALPIFDFLRSKLRDANADTAGDAKGNESTAKVATSAATESVKPPSLKLSPRFDALSSKTNAAINSLLDTVEKSSKSPSAPIFDALNAKQEESTEAATPSLRLSLSQPAVEPAPMDAQTLVGEMNTRLTDGKLSEAVTLFEDWRSSINPLTLESNKPDRTLYNLYMQAKLKIGADYDELHEVVSEMEEAGLPRDLAGYNILIRALFRKKDSAMAEKILERMETEEPQAQPDADSYNLVVVLCALDRKVTAATKYMKSMIDKGFEPSRTTVNEVLLASARSHQTQTAASLLKELKASAKLPMPMLNTCPELLMAASEVDDAECARLALVSIAERPMARFGPKMILDEGTLICVLGTAARTGDTALCSKAWEAICTHTRGMGRVPCPDAFLARIHALALSGDVTATFKAVWEFEASYGRKSDVDPEIFSPFTSLKSVASACSRGGAAALDAAYYKLEEAHSKKQGVAVAALNCIILGCSNLWDSERAFQTFEAIENVFGLRPDIHSCNALIHALGKTKMTEDALKVYDYIKEAGFKPDKWTYMLLSDAHVVNHDSKAALDVLQTMVDAGHLPLRQSTLKVWTRCKQYEDNEGLERLRKLEQDLNYRHCYFANARRKLLLDVLKS